MTLIPAPAGWRALLVDYGNGGSYEAPIIAWRPVEPRHGGSTYLEPLCATGDPPAYPRFPSEDELVAIYEPGHALDAGDFEMAAAQEKATREHQERLEAAS